MTSELITKEQNNIKLFQMIFLRFVCILNSLFPTSFLSIRQFLRTINRNKRMLFLQSIDIASHCSNTMKETHRRNLSKQQNLVWIRNARYSLPGGMSRMTIKLSKITHTPIPRAQLIGMREHKTSCFSYLWLEGQQRRLERQESYFGAT
mgnify:CR=1 FL=1